MPPSQSSRRTSEPEPELEPKPDARDSSPPGSMPSPSLPPPTDRIAVVVNGNAKSVTSEVIANLDRILLGGDLFVSRRIEEAKEIAETVVAGGYGTVLTGGGDGTFTVMVTEVVNAARRLQRPLPRFGFLKLGTGNALAHVVGASGNQRGALAADIQRLREDAGSRRVHLIEVGGLLAPFCGFGADAEVLRDYELVKKRLAHTPLKSIAKGPVGISATTRSIPGYLFKKAPHCRVINEGEPALRVGTKGIARGKPIPFGELIYEGPALIVGLSTIPYYGFGFRAFPNAEERPDRMSLRISTLRPLPFIKNFKGMWRGEYENPEALFDFLVQKVRIEMDPATPFQVGGDLQGERTSVQAKITSKPIRLVDFYAPPSAA